MLWIEHLLTVNVNVKCAYLLAWSPQQESKKGVFCRGNGGLTFFVPPKRDICGHVSNNAFYKPVMNSASVMTTGFPKVRQLWISVAGTEQME